MQICICNNIGTNIKCAFVTCNPLFHQIYLIIYQFPYELVFLSLSLSLSLILQTLHQPYIRTKNEEIDVAIVCDCLQLERDGPTYRPTDQLTDKASYRDAWTHLKKNEKEKKLEEQSSYEQFEPQIALEIRTLRLRKKYHVPIKYYECKLV